MTDACKPINLALQGGGAHGAFTWGVLDRLLEDGGLEMAGISGTSAGAMNAVCLADGFVRGGPEGARQALHDFWEAVGRSARLSPWTPGAFGLWMGYGSLDLVPAFIAFDLATRFLSPYDLNPLDINPLRDIVANQIDFDRVHHCHEIDLFISATNVWNGKVRIFSGPEVTLDAVMASACLPHLFRAVEIDGIPYWDGGYMGNPALFPFFHANKVEDILLVQINPIERRETPRAARDILNRMNEITFNASLLREFRAIEFVSRLIDDGVLAPGRYRNIRMHRIGSDLLMRGHDASSKFNADWKFLRGLRDLGRQAADQWLDEHYDALGHRATLDLRSEVAYRLDDEILKKRDRPSASPARHAAE